MAQEDKDDMLIRQATVTFARTLPKRLLHNACMSDAGGHPREENPPHQNGSKSELEMHLAPLEG